MGKCGKNSIIWFINFDLSLAQQGLEQL